MFGLPACKLCRSSFERFDFSIVKLFSKVDSSYELHCLRMSHSVFWAPTWGSAHPVWKLQKCKVYFEKFWHKLHHHVRCSCLYSGPEWNQSHRNSGLPWVLFKDKLKSQVNSLKQSKRFFRTLAELPDLFLVWVLPRSLAHLTVSSTDVILL